MPRFLDSLVLGLAGLLIALRHPQLVRRMVRRRTGPLRVPRLGCPETPDEMMLWRRVVDHDPRFTTISDKLLCKDWVAALGIGLDRAAVLWSGTDAAAMPEAVLAGDVVVKANHGCGTNLFPHRDGLGRDEVVRRANAFLAQDHGRRTHEWGYFGIPRRLFAEEVLGGGGPVDELKIYTFGRTVPRVVYIADRFGRMRAARWEAGPDGAPVRSAGTATISDEVLEAPLPPSFPRALALARAIGERFDHMRVDLLTDGERLWLGELTVYNLGGTFPDCSDRPDSAIARAWDLRRSWFLTTPQRGPLRRLYAGALRRALDRRAASRPPAPSLRAAGGEGLDAASAAP